MITARVTFAPANIRDVDGCDSQAAVDAVEAAAIKAAEAWAERHDIILKWNSRWRGERGMHTFETVVYGDNADDDAYESTGSLAEELEDILETASDRAIENGDWDDEAA